MSSEKIVVAKRVRLATSKETIDERGNIGDEWVAGFVKELVVFPNSHNARCRIRGSVRVALYVSYEPDDTSQSAWEQASEFKCEHCGQFFASSQGLGNHIATKHGKKGA